MTASETAILRIREEMRIRNLSQRELAERLKCSQGRVAKILNARVNLRVDDLAVLASAVGISLTEAVRDRGLEFHAEMTPTELRVLERLRQRPETLEAVKTLLDVGGAVMRQSHAAVPPRYKVGRPLNSEKRAAD